MYADGAPPNIPNSDGKTIWPAELKFVHDNPYVLTVDRAGNIQYSVCEYTYSEARANKVSQFSYFAQQYGAKKIYADMRSEANQMQKDPNHADQYGFSPILVNAMKNVYDVNILTDPNFDCYSTSFDPCNTMVQNWHNMRGYYLTEFFRDLRDELDTIDPNIEIAVGIPGGDYVGPCLGNCKLDWRTWVDEGLVNEIVLPIPLEADTDPYSATKDYLTNINQGIGILPISTFRDYIDNSDNPDIRLVKAGGSYLYREDPLTDYDGWRTDITYDLFDLAWHQRWEQLKDDANELGYVMFFDQDFNNINVYSGGLGNGFYDPTLQTCLGIWETLGDGNDLKPFMQSTIKHGTTGKALKISRDPNAPANSYVTARHYSILGGSKSLWSEMPISNGTCTFEFWLYRPDNNSSCAIGFQNDLTSQYGIGLYIPATGSVYYRYNNAGGASWYQSGCQITNATWTKLRIVVDIDNETYSAYADSSTICANIDYSGINPYNQFNWLSFSTQDNASSVIYIDDVNVKWYPDIVFEDKFSNIYMRDDFESQTVGATIHLAEPNVGATWKVTPTENASNVYVENDLSFAEGYKCLAFKRPSEGAALAYSGDTSKLPLNIARKITVDYDVYVVSGASTILGLCESDTGPYTALVFANSNGYWYYHDGSGYNYTNSNVSIDVDNWTHVQMVLDCTTQSYEIYVQPVGCMPTHIGTGAWPNDTLAGDSVYLLMSAQPGTSNTCYYDNIEITYGEPNVSPFTSRRSSIYLRDNFEAHAVDATIHTESPEQGAAWTVSNVDDANKYHIDTNYSLGVGSQSLSGSRCSSAATLSSGSTAKLTLDPNDIVTVDFDIYVPAATSMVVVMAEISSGPFPAALFANSNDKWYYRDNDTYIDSGVSIEFDTWIHCQMTLNCGNETCTYVIQQGNQDAVTLGQGDWDSGTESGDSVYFMLSPQSDTNDTCYYDNILITYGAQ
ncbi:MAG: hypothetical protein A2Y12_20465 [Planctomycetes bacterium GWF2_42_9]|nr:MAG: hypothetical protein A2Y12_20465 [Planctomycetes bacterium GWF2_42_9]